MLRVPVPFFLRTKKRVVFAFVVWNIVGAYYVWMPEIWKYNAYVEEVKKQKAIDGDVGAKA
jgi:hypothetical protein